MSVTADADIMRALQCCYFLCLSVIDCVVSQVTTQRAAAEVE